MAGKKKNADKEIDQIRATVKKLKDYAGGKSVYENGDELRDMAAILVLLCERYDELLSLTVDCAGEMDEMAGAIEDLEDFVYGDDDCDCDECRELAEAGPDKNGVYEITCPACKAGMEITVETLMMESTARCPACKAEIDITPVRECGCGGCKH